MRAGDQLVGPGNEKALVRKLAVGVPERGIVSTDRSASTRIEDSPRRRVTFVILALSVHPEASRAEGQEKHHRRINIRWAVYRLSRSISVPLLLYRPFLRRMPPRTVNWPFPGTSEFASLRSLPCLSRGRSAAGGVGCSTETGVGRRKGVLEGIVKRLFLALALVAGRYRLDEVCVSARQSFRFSPTALLTIFGLLGDNEPGCAYVPRNSWIVETAKVGELLKSQTVPISAKAQ